LKCRPFRFTSTKESTLTIIAAVRKRNGNGLPVQPSLFERREENPPLREAIDFYRHA